MGKYVIRANTESGPLYYMNFLMTTSSKEHAQTFSSKKAAEAESPRFKYLYDKAYTITIEQL